VPVTAVFVRIEHVPAGHHERPRAHYRLPEAFSRSKRCVA
jgi:hypothetical protein